MPTIDSVLGFTSFLFGVGYSHSWVECTDYDITVDIDSDSFLTDYYGSDGFDFHSGCKGYPRDRLDCGSETWDTCGLAYQPPLNDFQMCRSSIGDPSDQYSSRYNEQYPMAKYTVGNRYRLLWPAKNHAGYECQGDQRDNEMQLWVNLNPYPTQDIDAFVSGETLYSEMAEAGYTLVIDWHAEYIETTGETFALRENGEFDEAIYGEVFDNVGIDGVPFQNCPHFCDDMDDAVCYGDFDLPDIFPQDGIYTFIWWWEFKSHEKYSHCFEVYVNGTNIIGGSSDSDDGNGGNRTKTSNDDRIEQREEAVGAIVWSLVTFIIIFFLIAALCFFLRKKEMIICEENKIIFQKEPHTQRAPIAAHSATNLATHIVPDETNEQPPPYTSHDGYARPTGASASSTTGARRPPPPPPVR